MGEDCVQPGYHVSQRASYLDPPVAQSAPAGPLLPDLLPGSKRRSTSAAKISERHRTVRRREKLSAMGCVCGRQLPCGKGRRVDGGERPWRQDLEIRRHHQGQESDSPGAHCPTLSRAAIEGYWRHCPKEDNVSRRCCLAPRVAGYVRRRDGEISPTGSSSTSLGQMEAGTIDEPPRGILHAMGMARLIPPGSPATIGDVGCSESARSSWSNHVGRVRQVSPGGRVECLREQVAGLTWRGHWSRLLHGSEW